MPIPLYNTDIIPMTSRPTLTVMDDGDYFVILDTSTGKISKILKTLAMEALKISYDNTASGLAATQVQAALDELVVNLGSSDSAISTLAGRLDTLEADLNTEGSVLKSIKDNAENATYDNSTSGLTAVTLGGAIDEVEGRVDDAENNIDAIKGIGYTEGSLKTHEDRLDTLEGTGEGSVFKAIDDAVSPLAEVVDTNRLYSDSQYLDLKAKYDAQQIALNASKAELYTDDPILQYGATEIIGKGYEADGTPIDVSANVVDGKLSMEQKGLTITNLVDGADIANLGTVTLTTVLNDKYYDTLNNAILTGTGSDITATNNSGATANMAIYHLNALGLSTITDTDILAKLLPYVDGTQSVPKLGLQILDADDAVTQTIFLPAIGNSLPNGTADSIKTVADGWEHTKRVESGALSAEKLENGDFASVSGTDWAGWAESAFGDSSITNVGGKPRLQSPTGSAVSIGQAGKLTVGRLYKIVVDLTVASGTLKTDAGVPFANLLSFGNGVTTIYAIATGANLVLVRKTICDIIINSVSIKEIATTAGTPLAISAQTQVYDDGTTGYYQLATPVTAHYDFPLPTSGKTIHRFAGEEKIALYGTGLTFSENVLTVLSAVKFVAGEMTDITSLATITTNTVTFSAVSATDVVYVKVEHDVDRPLGILEHTPAVSNTASRLASLEARVSALEV